QSQCFESFVGHFGVDHSFDTARNFLPPALPEKYDAIAVTGAAYVLNPMRSVRWLDIQPGGSLELFQGDGLDVFAAVGCRPINETQPPTLLLPSAELPLGRFHDLTVSF